MHIQDRFVSPLATSRPRPSPAGPASRPAESLELSPWATLQGCPHGLQASPRGKSLARQAEALADIAATAAAGGPTQAATSQLLAQFRQGLCPYLAQATQQQPGDWSALNLLRQELEAGRLDPVEFLGRAHDHYGPSFQVGEVLFESRPMAVQQVLVETDGSKPERRNYEKSAFLHQGLGATFGGDSLFLLSGSDWKSRRELLAPFFLGDHVFTPETHEKILNTTHQHFRRWAGEPQPLDLNHKLRSLTLDIAVQHIFGQKLEPAEAEAMAKQLAEASRVAQQQVLGVGQDSTPLAGLQEVADRLLRDRRRGEPRNDAIQALLDSPLGERPQELRQEVVTLALLAHETTANLLSWACAQLVAHPEAVAELRQEYLDEIGAQSPTQQQIQGLDSARKALRETTRLHAPNYLLSRQVVQPVELEGRQLRPGTQVLMSLQDVNKDPEQHPEGEIWNPDRKDSRMYSFGAGQRVCLGQVLARYESQLILSQLFQHFDLKAVGADTLHPHSDLATRPANGTYELLLRN